MVTMGMLTWALSGWPDRSQLHIGRWLLWWGWTLAGNNLMMVTVVTVVNGQTELFSSSKFLHFCQLLRFNILIWIPLQAGEIVGISITLLLLLLIVMVVVGVLVLKVRLISWKANERLVELMESKTNQSIEALKSIQPLFLKSTQPRDAKSDLNSTEAYFATKN